MKRRSRNPLVLNSNGVIRLAAAHNALTAKLVERAGFDAVWASGLEISTSHGVPDANILTMTEFLNAAAEMADSVSIPVVADCDTGFGNSNNIIHLVRKYEAARIAAICIEDKLFPKVNSFVPGRQELAPIAEFVGKILAAKNTQETDDFVVIARVEALIAGWGMEEALRRAHAYATAGADAIFIHSKSTEPAQILEFAERWDGSAPLVVAPTTYCSVTVDELERAGVKVVMYTNHGMRAAVRAIGDVLGEILRNGGSRTVEDKIAPVSELFQLQGMVELKKAEKEYLRTENGATTAIVLAAGAGGQCDESLRALVGDRPRGMLDVHGRTVLQRQVETLRSVGVEDVVVVAGYRRAKIEDMQDVRVVVNEDYDTTHIVSSLMAAEDHLRGDVLVSYSDVLYDKQTVQRLLDCQDDFAILVDGSFHDDHRLCAKRIDRAKAERPYRRLLRRLDSSAPTPVTAIGKDVEQDETDYEFVGVSKFSARGCEVLRDLYSDLRRSRPKPFHEAPSLERASLTDLFQELIDRGHRVTGVEVNSGWAEVHTFDDYRRICALLSAGEMG